MFLNAFTGRVLGGGGDDPSAYTLSSKGIDTIWFGFAVAMVSTVIFYGMAFYTNASTKLFHYITAIISACFGLAYLMMALGMSNMVVNGHLVLWIRSVDYLVTTPLLLLDLGLLAGATVEEIVWMSFCDILMIASGYWASTAPTMSAAWPLFTFGCVAYAPVVWQLLYGLRAHAAARENKAVGRLYNFLSAWTIFLWTAYPLIWILYDGAKVMTADDESIVHCVLDILAKVVFGFVLLFSHDALHSVHKPGAREDEDAQAAADAAAEAGHHMTTRRGSVLGGLVGGQQVDIMGGGDDHAPKRAVAQRRPAPVSQASSASYGADTARGAQYYAEQNAYGAPQQEQQALQPVAAPQQAQLVTRNIATPAGTVTVQAQINVNSVIKRGPAQNGAANSNGGNGNARTVKDLLSAMTEEIYVDV